MNKIIGICIAFIPVNNTSVCRYCKILFCPPNTDTWTFYGGYTDINAESQKMITKGSKKVRTI